MIGPGLNYIGMKGHYVYKDKERNSIIFMKTTIIYPTGGRKGDDHIIITLTVADRMIYITEITTSDTWQKCDPRTLMAMMVTMMVILMVPLSYC